MLAQAAPPRPVAVLERLWGFSSFRNNQEEIINHALSGGDALVVMATGGGKSMCYQASAMPACPCARSSGRPLPRCRL
jgi:superfamily II DNA helicase RecQ